jgi:hypothetical protein
MASSYTRPCRTCQRRISMRQMPHGQWVAFENDEPHNCSKPPKVDVVRSTPRKSPQVDAPTEFDDIVVPGDAAPQPAPIARPVAPPQTAPPAPALAKPRPSRGLTNLRSHPATDVNRSLAGRRSFKARAHRRSDHGNAPAPDRVGFNRVVVGRDTGDLRRLRDARRSAFHCVHPFRQPCDLRDNDQDLGFHLLQYRHGHFPFHHRSRLALVLVIESIERADGLNEPGNRTSLAKRAVA